MMDKEGSKKLLMRMNGLMVYNKALESAPLMELKKSFMAGVCGNELGEHEHLCNCIRSIFAEAEKSGISGNIQRKVIFKLIRDDVNPFSMACERGHVEPSSSLHAHAMRDIEIMDCILRETKSVFQDCRYGYKPQSPKIDENLDRIEKSEPKEILDLLKVFYREKGCGDIACHCMHKVDASGAIIGIENSDPVLFSDLIGCSRQEALLRANIEAFICGMKAHDVLLSGSRGTGKSSCVKALANEYFDKGLRLIELRKDQAELISDILDKLRKRGKHFLIFMDDLSFDDFEVQYKHLKSTLEGGAQAKPSNVLFCATSNRRHIVKENWLDRKDGADEADVHSTDAINEKLSLSDRFGLTISFPRPNPEEYTDMAVELALRMGVALDRKAIREKALSWELGGNGRSGRTARQFAAQLAMEAAAVK